MFHNSGAYGPNGTPSNMGVPINRTMMPGQNTHHNLNNLSKINQQTVPTPSLHHNMPHFPNYGQPPMNPVFQSNMFESYNPMAYQAHYAPQNTTCIQENWQSSMLPMNLNTSHVGDSSTIMDNRLERDLDSDFRDQIYRRNALLNIPQVQKRAQNVSTDNICTYNSVSRYNNLEVSSKNSILLDDERRKSLENTVKLIENILIKSTTNKQAAPSGLIDSDPLAHTSVDTLKETEKYDERALDEVSDYVRSHDEKSQDEKYDDDKSDDESSNVHHDSIESTVSSQIELEEEDVKPDISELLLDDVRTGIVSKVMVKVEQTSWTDTEYSQPFDKDINGIHREDVANNDIIESDHSIEKAIEVINSGAVLNTYYECPHCTLFFGCPKRFLIHTKWHSLGQTAEKRIELAKEKELKRNQKREAKVMERMVANEVKDQLPAGKVYPCKDCDKMFTAKNSLKNHRQRCHAPPARACKICAKSLPSWAALRKHLASHAAGAGGYQCADCPKLFKYSQSLAKHRDTHLEKTHGCSECPKKFGSQALLKMHYKTHERQQRGISYRCTYCGKGFYEAYNLQVHERTHRNERPFTCDICNSNFGTNSSLKRHLRVSHSSSKPFECATCHRSFVSAAIRDRHQLRVHGDPEDFKFVCAHCPCRYMKSKDLQKHIYKVHPTIKRKKKVRSDSE